MDIICEATLQAHSPSFHSATAGTVLLQFNLVTVHDVQ